MHPSLSLVSHPLYHSCDLLKAFFFCLLASLFYLYQIVCWLRLFPVLRGCCLVCAVVVSFLYGFVLSLYNLFSLPFISPSPFIFLAALPPDSTLFPFTRFLVAFSFVCLFICSSPPFSESLRLHFQSLSLFFFCSLFLPSFLLQTLLPDSSQKLNIWETVF